VTIVEFLDRCLTEDQRTAEAALARVRRWPKDQPPPWEVAQAIAAQGSAFVLQRLEGTFADPNRVLAEIAAKRAVLKLYADAIAVEAAGITDPEESDQERYASYASRFVLEEAVRALALPLKSRAGWDPEWETEVTS